MELLKQFEKLIKSRSVVFEYDEEDGFFIKVTGQGQNQNFLKIAELIPTHNHNIENAISLAVEYLEENNIKH